MRKVAFLVIAPLYILLISAISVDASRGLKITQIDDLSHRSEKLGEYKALIIGINDYEDPNVLDLETAVNDATAIARLLEEKYGFRVQLLLDREATKEAIYSQLRKLATSSKPDDSILIYFAGHGDLDRAYNDGWWISSDAIAGSPVSYLSNLIVQQAIRSMKARHVLLISDSCYSGTLFGKARGLPQVIDDKYYLGLYNEKSRWGLTSGNKEPVSDAGSEGHSVFAYQLLKELKQNDKHFISIQEIYTRIAPIISNNSEQTPLCRPIQNTGDQGGEFVFVAAITEESHSTVTKAQKVILEMELAFWQSIQNSDDADEFKAYLDEFPNGKFASLARIKLKKLTQGKEIAFTSAADTKPQPAPEVKKARLFLVTIPANTRVRILNIKPKFYQGIELNPGIYHIEATAKEYATRKQWIRLSAGEERRMSIALEELPKTGTFHVSGSPYGASVYIDGNYKGQIPVLVNSVTSGSHKVRIVADGYEEKNERLSIDPGEKKSLKVSLERKVVAREDRNEKYENGIVYDTETGLEWYAGPDKDTTWFQAKDWVESLNVAGGGWRMPTIGELRTLHKKGIGPNNRFMTPLLKTTGWYVWSGETENSINSKILSVGTNLVVSVRRNDSYRNRSFAVRSRK